MHDTCLWLMAGWNLNNTHKYVDMLMTCPRKFLAVKSTPMVIYEDYFRIKGIQPIQAR